MSVGARIGERRAGEICRNRARPKSAATARLALTSSIVTGVRSLCSVSFLTRSGICYTDAIEQAASLRPFGEGRHEEIEEKLALAGEQRSIAGLAGFQLEQAVGDELMQEARAPRRPKS